MIFRKISKSDLPFFLSALDFGFSDGWTESMYISAFSTERFGGIIANNSECDIGFITFDISSDTADIEDVFVLPDYRKNGVGYALINNAFTYLRSKGVEKVFLEVRESNLSAINLYKKCGFSKISERKKYYPNGENALVFVKEF